MAVNGSMVRQIWDGPWHEDHESLSFFARFSTRAHVISLCRGRSHIGFIVRQKRPDLKTRLPGQELGVKPQEMEKSATKVYCRQKTFLHDYPIKASDSLFSRRIGSGLLYHRQDAD